MREPKKVKLFVTGINGRLGRAIAAEGSAQGHSVVGIDAVAWPVNKASLPKGVDALVGSYDDIALLERLLPGCDALIHTAGLHGAHIGKRSLAEFLHWNVEVVGGLLETAVRLGGRRVVLSSTMDVYVGTNWNASGACVLDEEAPPRTNSAYGISRWLVEQLGRHVARNHSVSVASLRYMCCGDTPENQLGVRLIARAMSIRDTARANLCAAAKDGLPCEVFNSGPKTPITNEDILMAQTDPDAVIEKYWPGASGVLTSQGNKPRSDDFWPVADIRKAQVMLDWEPEYTFETWLTDHGWTRH